MDFNFTPKFCNFLMIKPDEILKNKTGKQMLFS